MSDTSDNRLLLQLLLLVPLVPKVGNDPQRDRNKRSVDCREMLQFLITRLSHFELHFRADAARPLRT